MTEVMSLSLPPPSTSSPAIAMHQSPSPRSPTPAAAPSSSSPPPLDYSSSPTSSATASEPSTPVPVNHIHNNVIPSYPYNVSQVPQGHNGPAPDDLGITTRLPSICVDYLSHEWAEDDIWTSWKAMTRHKAEIANGVRLENASWRTWAKQRGKLKTISPETLNWLKDSDVTWLYGPLHTAVDAVPPPRIATASERLGLEPLRSLSDSKVISDKGKEKKTNRRPQIVTKPILKYRSLSDILLPPNTPSSPILESIDELDYAGVNLVNRTKSDTHLRRSSSVTRGGNSKRRSASVEPVDLREASPDRALASDSSTSTGSSGAKAERRHISFNHRVEQCIAVDSTEEAKKYPNASSTSSASGSDDEGDDEDDVLTFRSSPRVANFGPSVMSAAHRTRSSSSASGREPHTIVRLGPTTLKSTELWPSPSPAVVYQNQQAMAPSSASPDAYGPRRPSGQAVPTYSTRSPTSQQAGGRKAMYDYSNASGEAVMNSQWDPDDDEDYAMGFDYFTGPDVMVADEYDTAQYGSQHLVGTSHNNYQGGSTAAAYLATGSTPPSYNPYAPSSVNSTSTESSPNQSRRSSASGSASTNPASPTAGTVRGPHAPATTSKDAAPPKRSILKGAPPRSREPSVTDDSPVVSAASSPQVIGSARFSSASSTSPTIASPPTSVGSASPVIGSSPQLHPVVRRAASEEFREREREGRGRSTSRGSSSSLERSASADRRSSLSPASSYVSLATAGQSPSGSRPIGIPSSRRGGSSDALNTLAGGMPGSRLMPDLPEASNESEGETVKTVEEEEEEEEVQAPVHHPHVVGRPDSPLGVVETVEDVALPSMIPHVATPPIEILPSSPSPPPSPILETAPLPEPQLEQRPSSFPPTVPAHPSTSPAVAPRYRQPSPIKPASSLTTDEEAHAVDLHSLSNSPSLDAADLAATQWSDEPSSSSEPSYARRSLLRAARGTASHSGEREREEGTGRASVEGSHDDYGFGYYDEDAEPGLVGRTLDVAGTARDLIGALSRGLWSVASGRRTSST